MSTLAVILIGYGLILLGCWAICSDSKRREQEQARAMHPSNWPGMEDHIDGALRVTYDPVAGAERILRAAP